MSKDKMMNISELDVNNHIVNKGDTLVIIHDIAKGSKYEMIPYEEIDLKNSAYSLNRAGFNTLIEVDTFANQNIDIIKIFLDKLRLCRKNRWELTLPFLYELIAIIKQPTIFTEDYQKKRGWNEDIADAVKRAITECKDSN